MRFSDAAHRSGQVRFDRVARVTSAITRKSRGAQSPSNTGHRGRARSDQRCERHIRPAMLDVEEVLSAEMRALRQFFLRQLLRLTLGTDYSEDQFM